MMQINNQQFTHKRYDRLENSYFSLGFHFGRYGTGAYHTSQNHWWRNGNVFIFRLHWPFMTPSISFALTSASTRACALTVLTRRKRTEDKYYYFRIVNGSLLFDVLSLSLLLYDLLILDLVDGLGNNIKNCYHRIVTRFYKTCRISASALDLRGRHHT